MDSHTTQFEDVQYYEEVSGDGAALGTGIIVGALGAALIATYAVAYSKRAYHAIKGPLQRLANAYDQAILERGEYLATHLPFFDPLLGTSRVEIRKEPKSASIDDKIAPPIELVKEK